MQRGNCGDGGIFRNLWESRALSCLKKRGRTNAKFKLGNARRKGRVARWRRDISMRRLQNRPPFTNSMRSATYILDITVMGQGIQAIAQGKGNSGPQPTQSRQSLLDQNCGQENSLTKFRFEAHQDLTANLNFSQNSAGKNSLIPRLPVSASSTFHSAKSIQLSNLSTH